MRARLTRRETHGDTTLPEETSRIAAEIAHVLFVDLVGYSLSSMEGQSRLVRELREVVRATPEFIEADKRRELISNDTGDGMSLIFFRDPLSPVQCATEIARAARTHGGLRLRMGIHSGPVSRVMDINGKETVSGSGVNMGQRVMDCGDAGHILLSAASANVLGEFETWANCLRDLGEYEVKHGIRLHLFNLLVGEVGNPAMPAKLTPTVVRRTAAPDTTPSAMSAREGATKVVLLYKRKDTLSERLLNLLEIQLKQRGLDVFIDRHLKIGEEWAKEITYQIRSADAVVPLLSAASVGSEMMEFEIEEANKAAQEQGGRPRLLPIRVSYEGALPDVLAAILDPLQYSLWEAEGDDERVTTELLDAITGPPKEPTPARRGPAGGAVPLDSEFYILRPTDGEFREAIARRDSIVLVKGGRQMGKTSLLARGLQQAREKGSKVVFTDFQALASEHLVSADALYRALAEMIADQLDLEVLPDEVWNEKRSANMNLERYLRREVLGTFSGPLVWGLDEVDRLFTCPFGSEVFGLFRSWHNRRSLDPAAPWARLTLAIAYATEAHLFITDLNQSPFNVGTRLALFDFDQAQMADLNRRYGSPLHTEGEISRFQSLIGGQPYLSCRGLDEMASQGMEIASFEVQAATEEGLFGDHLRRILFSLSQDHELTEAVRSVLRGGEVPTPESFYRLRGAGVITGDSAHSARLRCRLYGEYLSRHLL
jgi:class 3 adenylate cyclase